jgi:hypothetical protein
MLNLIYITRLQYHIDEHTETSANMPRMTIDIFDGLHYHLLLRKHVVVGD